MTSKYKLGFFISLGLFLVFWIWIIIAIILGNSPRDLLRLSDRNIPVENHNIIDPSYYESTAWISEMIPSKPTIQALEESGNTITVHFSQEMDTDFAYHSSTSAYTIDNPLDYTNAKWTDSFTFQIKISRALVQGEYLFLVYDFRTEDGRNLPSVMFNYE